MEHTKIPPKELEIISQLKDVKVVFDVGARTDTEYFDLFPKAEFHLFEPNIDFFQQLKNNVGKRKNVYLNNFGLGDKAGRLSYSDGLQAFEGAEGFKGVGERTFNIQTLNSYVKKRNIKNIDFLKIDTEGYDYKVLKGGMDIVPKIRYVQYEHWDDKKEFYDLLEDYFHLEEVGYRNVLCINHAQKDTDSLVKFILQGEYGKLA